MIHFGTDGWRGRIGREFTFEKVRTASQAFAAFLSKHHPRKGSLVVGYDRRFLADQFAKSASEVLVGNGFKVLFFSKPVPTPLVSFTVHQTKALGGMVLTASHNPAEFLGMKLKDATGASYDARGTEAVERLLSHTRPRQMPFEEGRRRKRITLLGPGRTNYISSLHRRLDPSFFKKRPLKILVDCLHGVTGNFAQAAFSIGSLRLEILHGERDVLFGGHPPEPIREHLGELVRKMKNGRYDIGLALDGDGDRLAAVGPGGLFLSPSEIFAIVLFHLVEKRRLRGKVVRTVSCSSLVDRLAASYGLPLEEVPVGFKHIASRMKTDPDFLLGGEESGGLGFRGRLPERDGLLSALFLLESLAAQGQTVNQILGMLKKRFGSFETDRIDLPYPKEGWAKLVRRLRREGRRLLPDGEFLGFRERDGLKLVGENRWLLFRMSGTEPLLRIYAEGRSQREVKRLLEKGKNFALKGRSR